jgi:hypothetical protein
MRARGLADRIDGQDRCLRCDLEKVHVVPVSCDHLLFEMGDSLGRFDNLPDQEVTAEELGEV